ncbi:hypothetical protein QL285_053418 [Trifolium repens]|nr:hypothetical protein QL285_053418 [Trifolium repens]
MASLKAEKPIEKSGNSQVKKEPAVKTSGTTPKTSHQSSSTKLKKTELKSQPKKKASSSKQKIPSEI